MNIIPVIDLLNGVVVHAKKGQRASYLPINSMLSRSNKPLDIVKAFLDFYPFNTLYIADLDAIQKTLLKNNLAVIEKIKQHFPTINIWLDAGISTPQDLKRWQSLQIHPVIGSENQLSMNDFNILNQSLKNNFTLSLDFMPTGYRGPEMLLEPSYWPQNVIVMTLARVGANNGVDTKTLDTILKKRGQHNIYAAGGVRHAEDLQQLCALGVQGALVASALHHQQLTHDDIAKCVAAIPLK